MGAAGPPSAALAVAAARLWKISMSRLERSLTLAPGSTDTCHAREWEAWCRSTRDVPGREEGSLALAHERAHQRALMRQCDEAGCVAPLQESKAS